MVKLKLIYDPESASKPILSQVVLKTGVAINILEARTEPTAGELVVDVPTTGEKLREVVSAFREHGVIVKEIMYAVELDRDRCIACGACISPCPTQAISFDENWDVVIDDSKCVRCGLCATICPVKALRAV